MTLHPHSHLFSSTGCITEQAMFAYIDNKLSSKERHTVELHLLDCEMCTDALEGLEQLKDRRKLETVKQRIHERIHAPAVKEVKIIRFDTRAKLAMAAAIAVLCVSVFFLNDYLKTSPEQKMVADQLMKEDAKPEESLSMEPPPPPPPPNQEAEGDKDPAAVVSEPAKASGALAREQAAPAEEEVAAAEALKTDELYKAPASRDEGNADNIALDDRSGKDANLSQGAAGKKQEQAPADLKARSTVEDKKAILAQSESKNSKAAAEKETMRKDADLGNSVGTGSTATGGVTTVTSNATTNAATAPQPDLSKNKTKEEQKNEERTFTKSGGAKKKGRSNGYTYNNQRAKTTEKPGNVAYAPTTVNDNYNKEQNTNTGEAQDAESTVAPENAQKVSEDEVFSIVEEMPSFPGGEVEMLKFIDKNLQYPVIEKEKGIQGKVYVSFIVHTDGSIQDVKVLRGIAGGPNCDKEAVRVIKAMPKWTPGKQAGKVVRVQYTYPVAFRIK